eukprot:jgi/Tetstr1/437723/TSEL_026377.t1
MNPHVAGNFARTAIPAVYDKLRSNLTNYGLNEAVKQERRAMSRHFWAVFINFGRGAFHLGMIHELWFRQAQPMLANAGEDEADIGALHLQLGDHNHVRDRIGKMAVYGELLGAAKRAIQAVVDGALPHA